MPGKFMEWQSHHELANVTLSLPKNHTGANADSRRGRPQFRYRSGTAPPQVRRRSTAAPLHTTDVAPPCAPFSS